MNSPTWQDRLWYAAWYFLIPAALAIAVVQGLALTNLIDDAAPWQYLLAFAVLEVVVLGVRDRIYGVHRPGTAYRMDEVPIPLRRILPTDFPSDGEVLAAILKRLS